MTNSYESEKRHSKEYMDAYARLTRVLTNMFASERTSMDQSPLYSEIMDMVIAGRDREAIMLAELFRDERGDAWRVRAAECGLIANSDFVHHD